MHLWHILPAGKTAYGWEPALPALQVDSNRDPGTEYLRMDRSLTSSISRSSSLVVAVQFKSVKYGFYLKHDIIVHFHS